MVSLGTEVVSEGIDAEASEMCAHGINSMCVNTVKAANLFVR